MSELQTQSPAVAESAPAPVSYSRSRIQRDEIGPVFHDIAHKVYDATELAIVEGGVVDILPENLDQLSGSLQALEVFLKERSKEQAASEEWAKFKDGCEPRWFTLQAHQVLSEGLLSGVAAPFRLLQTVVSYEKARDTYGNQTLERQDIILRDWSPRSGEILPSRENLGAWADRVDEPEFARMLSHLAYSGNGFLGVASTHLEPLNATPSFGLTWDMSEGFFLEDAEGKVVGLHSELLAHKKHMMANAPYGAGTSSGGCPVRHSEFTRLGSLASEFLAAVNTDGRPVNEGESAIERGARLLSFTLRYMAEIPEA
ncbi:hypothetical protein KC963_04835 [Candidatus Saccharibacteria bacterium]|nr:hypothetical protein [Candidatus Saccharibacteria bacterium]